MKRALVFSGGGSRGAYEIGAWKALRELGVRYSAVYGTSIGAINAAVAAQGDVDTAVRLWETMDMSRVVASEDGEFAISRMISGKRDVLPFLLENAKYLQADISPLEKLLRESISEGKVRASGLTLGVMTVRVPQLQPCAVRLSEMKIGSLHDWLLASAACFPVFPLRKVGADRYADGGYFDNLPIDMAIRDGADEIVALDVHPAGTHPEYARMPFLTTVRPRRELGGFLDFKPETLRALLRTGYRDAMKVYGRFEGFRYTFVRDNSIRAAVSARRYMQALAAFEAENIRREALGSSHPAETPLMEAVEAETLPERLSWRGVRVRGLELAAGCMGFTEDAVYVPDELTARMLAFAEKSVSGSFEEASSKGSRALTAYFYRLLAESGDGRYPADRLRAAALCPNEAAAALYLDCEKRAPAAVSLPSAPKPALPEGK